MRLKERDKSAALCYICSLLSGLADFRRKKHGNLCSPLITPQPKAESSGSGGISKGKSLDAATIKISVAFYKEGCKPWVFVSFGPSQKKKPFGGEPRQAIARKKPTIVTLNAVKNLSVKDPSYLRIVIV